MRMARTFGDRATGTRTVNLAGKSGERPLCPRAGKMIWRTFSRCNGKTTGAAAAVKPDWMGRGRRRVQRRRLLARGGVKAKPLFRCVVGEGIVAGLKFLGCGRGWVYNPSHDSCWHRL